MDSNHFSSSNINNFIRNKKLKESLKDQDFTHFQTILKKLNEIDESILSIKGSNNKLKGKKQGINCEIEELNIEEVLSYFDDERNNFSNIENIQSDTFSQSTVNNSNLQKLEEISKELRENLFNLKGEISYIRTTLNKEKEVPGIELTFNNLRFNVDIVLKDGEFEYNLSLVRIKPDLTDNINKFTKKSMTYFTNMKAFMKERDSSGQIVVFFQNRSNTKIYSKAQEGINNDYEVIYSQRKSLKKMYNMEKIRLEAGNQNPIQSKIEILDNQDKTEAIHNINSSQSVTHTKSKEIGSPQAKKTRQKSISFSKRTSFSNILDLTKNNEASFLDIIDSGNIDQIIFKIPEELRFFSDMLEVDTENAIYGMTNINRVNKFISNSYTICGIVETYKKKNNNHIIKIVSLSDSNFITVFMYNKNTILDIQENMLLFVQRATVKINKHFDIVVDIPSENCLKILGLLTVDAAKRFRKFRISKNCEIESLVSLVRPRVIRRISKYLLTVKKVYRVRAELVDKCSEIVGFPKMRLSAKCLVDDGTLESNAYLDNYSVIKLFHLDKPLLTEIDKLLKTNPNITLYDPAANFKYLPRTCFDDLFPTQLIAYCVPFSAISNKNYFLDKNYMRFFDNIHQDSNLKQKASNLIFINGEILYDNFYVNLSIRPYLKVLHFDYVDL